MNDEQPKLPKEMPADTLHAHVENHISLPHSEEVANTPLMEEVSSHPNLQSHSIEKLYNHVMAPVTPDSTSHLTGDAEPKNDEILSNLLHHPNTPKHLKQDFALKTFNPSNPSYAAHEEMADSGILDENQLKGMIAENLKHGRIPYAYKHVSPDYYLDTFKNRSQEDTEGMDKAGQEAHKREIALGYNGILNSSKHTPQSLDRAIDALSNNKAYKSADNEYLLGELVKKRHDLSKDQLNKIHQWSESNRKPDESHWDSSVDKILQHKNVDPALLAKYAVGKDVRQEALKNPQLPKESVNAFIRRVKDPNDWQERRDVDALLENPSITKEQVKALVKKGSTAAIHHELADEEDVRNLYNKSSKSADDARNILRAKRLPPDVLKELVNHKNQEIAVSALYHPNADIDVVNEGLKRRAKTVQDAARVHPLVAESQVREGLKSGSTGLSKIYTDNDYSQNFDKMPKIDQDAIFSTAHDKYKGDNISEIAKKTKERPENVIFSKYQLAKDPRVPDAIREVHSKDLANLFEDKIGKNAEMKDVSGDILSDAHEGDATRIVKAVSDLAHSGDKNAQSAILDNPAILHSIASHQDLDDAPGDFLEKAFRRGQEYERSGTQVYTSYGSPRQFGDQGNFYRKLFSSPNLPESTFHEMATNPQLMDKIGETSDFKRYNDLPEDQQNQKYDTILNSGSHAAAASILHTNAPPQSWDRAFNTLGGDERRKFLSDNIVHVKKHRPDVFQKSVLGTYNEPGRRAEGYDHYQKKAIQALDPESTQDRSTLERALSTPEGESGHVDDSMAIDSIPSSMYNEPGDDSLIDHVISLNRMPLACRMIGEKVTRMSDKIHSSTYSSEQEKLRNKEAGNTLLSYINQKMASMPIDPEGSDNPLAQNWYNLLVAKPKGYSDSVPDALKYAGKYAGIDTDFLADMPGEWGSILRKEAYRQNLVSKDKASQASSIEDVLATGDPKLRQVMFNNFLDNPKITGQDVDRIAKAMNQTLLNPEAFSRSRRSMSDDAYQVYQSRLNKITDLFNSKDPDSVSDILSQALRSPDSAHDLTKEDLSRIQKGTLEHALSKTYPSISDKNLATYNVYKGFRNSKVPGTVKLLNQIEQSVFDNSDYETMTKMADDGTLSGRGMERLSKVIAQPGILDAKQVAGISSQLDSSSLPSTVINMAKAFESKAATASPAVKVKFMNNLAKTYEPSMSDAEGKAKNDFIVNYVKKATLDPATAPFANTKLKSLSVQMSGSDMEQALNIYESLPSDESKFSNFYLNEKIPVDMANNPRFIAASTSGWKLRNLAANAESLTGENASTLVSRAVSPEGESITRADLFRKLDKNEYVQPEDSIKLARSMNDDEMVGLFNNTSGNTMNGNIIFAAHARLGNLEALMKDPNLASPDAPAMGEEHTGQIITHMQALSGIVHDAKFGEDTANLKDKLAKTSEIISALHGHSKTLISHLERVAGTESDKPYFNNTVQHLLSVATNLSQTGLSLDREDALKITDMINDHHVISSVTGEDPSETQTRTAGAVQSIVQRAENYEEQDWRDIFQSAPHAVLSLSSRSNIPSEALNASNYQQFAQKSQNKDESRTKEIFVKESSKWFSKMSGADVEHHGKNLLNMYVKLLNDNEIFENTAKEGIQEGLKYIGSSLSHKDTMDLLANAKKGQIREPIFKASVESGIGGPETMKEYVKENSELPGIGRSVKDWPRGDSWDIRQKLEPLLRSPHIDDEIASKIVDSFKENPEAMGASIHELVLNKSTPSKAISDLSSYILQNKEENFDRTSTKLASQIMQHPNVSEDQLGQLFAISNEEYPKYFSSEGRFNPALTNPTHGGRLFRAMPIHVPEEVPHADTAKMTKNVNLQHKDYKKMQEVMGLIPAEGMAWAEFKRKFPAQEKSLPQSIKQVFTSANNKLVMPEQFAQAMRSLDDNAKKYHLTYSQWSSDLQKHREGDSKPNLVVQVNNSEESEKELSQDPKLWALYQHLLQKTNGIKDGSIGLHPTTPHLVSWSRVDTDQGGQAWAIEEYQSDFAQKFRKNLKALMSQFPSGSKINGQHVTAEDMQKYMKTIDNHLSDWSEASMQAVIDNAKANGIKKLYMHGAELRGMMSGGYSREDWDNPNTRSRTVGFRKIYDENPRDFGFQECDYTDYPQYSTKMLDKLKKAKLKTNCWVLNLEDKKPRAKRKA